MSVQQASLQQREQEHQNDDLVRPSAAARITEIDITLAARTLSILRWSDYVLVVVCGFGLVGLLSEAVAELYRGQLMDAATGCVLGAAFAYAAYTGWRHVGVIDPRVWKSYLRVFPLLLGAAALIGLSVVPAWRSGGLEAMNLESFMSIAVAVQFAGVAIPGFICAVILRHAHIPPGKTRLQDFLLSLTARAPVRHLSHLHRVDVRKGLLYAAGGAIALLVVAFAPLEVEGTSASTSARLSQQVSLLGFFLIVRARRFFQVSADSLLAVDKRPPILFLRSFADDEQQRYASSQSALLDFSLETRLANHFHRFGPFIAIGSPKESVPQPGAARVRLADDEWQARVLGWMRDANLIIMYCGTTQWVNWELRRVIESGRATSLILMFPESKAKRRQRKQDIEARVQQMREVFSDTDWSEELTAFRDFADLRAMLFRPDGSMLMVRSRSRRRDAYHLAALVAHQRLLDPAGAASIPRPRKRGSLALKIAAAVGVVLIAMAGLVYLGMPDHGTRLAFKKGELYYASPVTAAEAQSVGTFLVDYQFFTDEREVSVRLHRPPEAARLTFVVDPARADDPAVTLWFQQLGGDVSASVPSVAPMDIELANHFLEPLRLLPRTARLSFGNGGLYYSDPVTAAEAQSVGQALQSYEFFGGERAVTAHLRRIDGSDELSFTIAPSALDDPTTFDAFAALSTAVAAEALPGKAIVLNLVDTELNTVRRERIEPQARTH